MQDSMVGLRVGEQVNYTTESAPKHEQPVVNQTISLGRATPHMRSYVNDVVDALRQAKRPLHLRELASLIRTKRDKSIPIGSLKVCLSRYLDNSDSSKILVRLSPGVFGLKEWFAGAGEDSNSLASLSLRQLGVALSLNGPSQSAATPEPASLQMTEVFVWTVPADVILGFDAQRVYVRAHDEADARKRLTEMGVVHIEQGRFHPAHVWLEHSSTHHQSQQ